MTPFTNIHVAEKNLRESAQSADTNRQPGSSLPRLRKVTNDPAREYAQRPGEVEQLSNAIAALILSKQGFSKVSRNGIRIEGVTEKPLVFWHEHSITIAEKAGTNEKVLWTLNRLQPDVLHILGKDGDYIESIPLDEKAEWFNPEHLHKVLGAKRRSQQRIIERVAALHRPDSEAAVAAATANDTAMKSIVHTFAAGTPARAPARNATHSVAGGRDRSGSPFSPRDRQHHPADAGPERIDPEHTNRAGNLASPARTLDGQRCNLGEQDKSAETVELPSRAEGLARSSARGAFAAGTPAHARDRDRSFPKASRIHEIQLVVDERRKHHEDREQARASAAQFGQVLRDFSPSETAGVSPANLTTPTEIEEW
jgi:hypothetical protein